MIGNVCFSADQEKNNYKIRALFQREIIPIPYIIPNWNSIVENIPWEKVWTLPHRYLLTNKVKEITFKLIHKCYPTKIRHWRELLFLSFFWRRLHSFILAMFLHWNILVRFLAFIQCYFVSDFSFCFHDAFMVSLDCFYSKENIGKYYIINVSC